MMTRFGKTHVILTGLIIILGIACMWLNWRMGSLITLIGIIAACTRKMFSGIYHWRTFRDLTNVIEGTTTVVLAEDIRSWRAGVQLVILWVMNNQGVVFCRTFGGEEVGLISLNTKIK